MHTCEICNIDFQIRTEYWFHVNVDCKQPRKRCFHIGNTGSAPSKKHSDCYRCGRTGHYYFDRECCATTDVDGNPITWGIKGKSPTTFVNRRNKRVK